MTQPDDAMTPEVARRRFEIASDAAASLEDARDLLGKLPLWPVTPARLVFLYEAKRFTQQAYEAAACYRDFLAEEAQLIEQDGS